MATYVLFNPLSANGKSLDTLERFKETHKDLNVIVKSTIEMEDKIAFLECLKEEDEVILLGGDGTVNYFANAIDGYELKNKIYYYPGGTGNDLLTDLKEEAKDNLIYLNPYLKNLPTLTVNGKSTHFLNGVGYGIDGYCCTVGLEKAKKSTKPVNYTAIAIKLLLFTYKPRNAKVTVDGVTKEYKHVWLAPTMKGRYYGGGMMVAPNQDRKSDTLSVVIMHKSRKLKTLMVFPSIFKGEHIKHTEMIDVLTGKDIKVEFDKPTDLQVDGEVYYNVTEYSVKE